MRSSYHRRHLRQLIAAATVIWVLTLASVARASDLIVAGAGDGHGVGMSQEGARGYAEHGYGYRAILAHYYAGTAIWRTLPAMSTRTRAPAGARPIAVPA